MPRRVTHPRLRRGSALALTLALGSLSGCAGGGPSGAPPSASSSSALPVTGGSPSIPAVRSPRRTGSPEPSAPPSVFPSSLPGLTGWTVVTPGAVDIDVIDGAIRLTLTKRALWFQGTRGVLVGQPVTGDFRITATVSATDRAGTPLTDRSDGLVELGGLMARAENAVRENYVFVVVGTDPDGLSVETKTTRDSNSRFAGPAWPSAAADLRLCRTGSTFSAWKRAAGSAEAWQPAATYDRPDLPETVQVGPNIYANGAPDLIVTFTGLRIEPSPAGEACEAA